jgi:hypothetical protein
LREKRFDTSSKNSSENQPIYCFVTKSFDSLTSFLTSPITRDINRANALFLLTCDHFGGLSAGKLEEEGGLIRR